MSRDDRLRAFVEGFGKEAVVWGRDDCSAAPARWIEEETGRKLELPDYHSREEAHAVIAKAGSLAAVWSEVCDKAGIREQYQPALGDIGIIDTRKYGQIGGIVTTGRILLIRQDDGGWQAFGPVRQFVRVWAIE